jgi:tRNA A37 threonylcarbamoyladenosine modification protein TsaB
LEAVAYPLREQGLPVCAIIQAGRGRILAACYDWIDEHWQMLDEPQLTNFEALAPQIKEPAWCIGEIDEGSARVLHQGSGRKARIGSPAARLRRTGYLAELAAIRLKAGELVDPDRLEPIYPAPL